MSRWTQLAVVFCLVYCVLLVPCVEADQESLHEISRRSTNLTLGLLPPDFPVGSLKNATPMACSDVISIPSIRLVQMTASQMRAMFEDMGGSYVKEYMAATLEEAHVNFPNLIKLSEMFQNSSRDSPMSMYDNFITKQVIQDDLQKLMFYFLNKTGNNGQPAMGVNTSPLTQNPTTTTGINTATSVSSARTSPDHVTTPPGGSTRPRTPSTYRTPTVPSKKAITTKHYLKPPTLPQLLQSTTKAFNIQTATHATLTSRAPKTTHAQPSNYVQNVTHSQSSPNVQGTVDMQSTTHMQNTVNKQNTTQVRNPAHAHPAPTQSATPITSMTKPITQANSVQSTTHNDQAIITNNQTVAPASVTPDLKLPTAFAAMTSSIPDVTSSAGASPVSTTYSPEVSESLDQLQKYLKGQLLGELGSNLSSDDDDIDLDLDLDQTRDDLERIWREANTTLHPGVLLGLKLAAPRVRREATGVQYDSALNGSNTMENYCQSRGAYTSDRKFVHLCSSCAATTRLSEDYFPRYINEVVCKQGDTKCFTVGNAAHGECKQNMFALRLLRRRQGHCSVILHGGEALAVDDWHVFHKAIRVACECTINKLSVFKRYVAAPAVG